MDSLVPTWDEWFEDVWDALVAKVVGISDFGASKVFYGKKFPPTTFPAAFIQPTSADSSPVTMRETQWAPTFRIYIVVEKTDPKEGTLTAWKLAGKVIDALEADRTLSNTLHNLECGPVMDSPERLGFGIEQHWVSVDIRCMRKL